MCVSEYFNLDVEVDPLHTRVDQWMNQSDIFGVHYGDNINDNYCNDDTEVAKSSFNVINHRVEEHVFVEDAVRSLHASSKMAHLSGVNLREIPALRTFSSLRTINLSNNFIGQCPLIFTKSFKHVPIVPHCK